MTGRELIDTIRRLNAEDLVVYVGSEGYASALHACDADEYRVVGDDGVSIDRCLLLHDSTGIYYTGEVSLYE